MKEAPDSLLVLLLLVAADFVLTALHAYQEWKGRGAPLWRNFGAIVGVKLPDGLGFFLFTFALTVTLLALGFAGIIGPFGTSCTALALGALIGARVSDTLVSHVMLYGIGYRPNPGLPSTPLYIVEAALLAWLFQQRLMADPHHAKIGLAVGVIFFVLVLPSLWLLRFVAPSLRRTRWERGQEMPAWASDP